jgi:peptidoglycan/xylan/chitin deacetylase (PgdA/CDA1 family)
MKKSIIPLIVLFSAICAISSITFAQELRKLVMGKSKKLLILLPLLSLTSIQNIFSQDWKICNWKDDKKGAVVLTFDDWSPGQFPVAVPELNSRGLVSTISPILDVVAPWNHNWPDVVTTAAAGHEIGNHTKSHPDLTTSTSTSINTEVRGAKNTIDIQVPSQKVVSFIYPFGTGTGGSAKHIEVRDSVKASGHIGARGVIGISNYTYNFAATDDDYYKIKIYGMDGTRTTNAFAGEITKIINGGGLLVYLYHSVDDAAVSHGDNWYALVIQDSLQKQLDTLVALQDQVWVTTFGKAVRYHKEKNSASLSEVYAPDGALWVVNLTDTLDNNSVYNEPLTLKMKMNGVAYDTVTQNGLVLPIDSIYNDTIMFRAIPDGGEIALTVGPGPTNLQPTLDFIPDMIIDQDAGPQTVNLTGITSGGAESQNLTVSVYTYNDNLFKMDLVQSLSASYTSPNNTGSISFTPNINKYGATTIVVRVQDDASLSKFVERSFTVYVNKLSGIGQEFNERVLQLTPNPANDIVKISSEVNLSNVELEIADLNGKTVLSETFSYFKNKDINISFLKPGMYMIRIRSDQGYLKKKLVVK